MVSWTTMLGLTKQQRRQGGALQTTIESGADDRLLVDARMDHRTGSQLLEDARAGLTAARKHLPPKYLYDAEGSRLFDAICDEPEYYPTRTEAALLDAVAQEIMALTRPTQLVELGSGAARKTRTLLETMYRVSGGRVFVPMDVSEEMLRRSGRQLVEDYPWLTVHGLVGDYAETLSLLPPARRRLVAFLGGTVGNYEDDAAVSFLSAIRERLGDQDALLMGADLVKDKAILDAAYNDASGVTAAFNKNVLRVLNRELGGDLDVDAFEHLAFYDEDLARVEMHLLATRPVRAHFIELDLTVAFEAGETLHTEISRKFTRPRIEGLLGRAGFELREWFTPDDDYFSLSLAVPA
jgi:L-histidine N-alpha-methyltransferase